jgi:hypothetical protein
VQQRCVVGYADQRQRDNHALQRSDFFADRATENYSSGPTNGFVKTTQSGVEQMLSAYYLPGATGTYSSSFTTVSAATYVTAIVAFRSRTFQRSHINFVK